MKFTSYNEWKILTNLFSFLSLKFLNISLTFILPLNAVHCKLQLPSPWNNTTIETFSTFKQQSGDKDVKTKNSQGSSFSHNNWFVNYCCDFVAFQVSSFWTGFQIVVTKQTLVVEIFSRPPKLPPRPPIVLWTGGIFKKKLS